MDTEVYYSEDLEVKYVFRVYLTIEEILLQNYQLFSNGFPRMEHKAFLLESNFSHLDYMKMATNLSYFKSKPMESFIFKDFNISSALLLNTQLASQLDQH